MPDPVLKLSFIKLNVPEMAPALDFWIAAMGFAVTDTFDEEHFLEHILTLPGQEGHAGPHLMLVQWKSPTDVAVGNGHGPVGFVTHDVAASLERAVAAGATVEMDVTEVAPGLTIAKFISPQGHEAELVHQKPQDK